MANALITAYRYHDFSMGHRVPGHEGACKHLHGHNYRVHFYVEAPKLDKLGRAIDFSVIKSTLCQWLEDNWDHKMVLAQTDPYVEGLADIVDEPEGLVLVPFIPTAENLADYLLQVVGPAMLSGTEVVLYKVQLDETRKCSAIAEFASN